MLSSWNTGDFVQIQPNHSLLGIPPADQVLDDDDLPTASDEFGTDDNDGGWQVSNSPEPTKSLPMLQQGSQVVDQSRQPFTASVSDKDWVQLSRDMMTAGQNLPKDQQQLGLGLVIMLADMLNNNRLDEGSAIQAYQLYSSHFGRNQAGLFSQGHEEMPPIGMVNTYPQVCLNILSGLLILDMMYGEGCIY